MLEPFTTAVNEAFEETADDTGDIIPIDGRECHFYRPTDGQLAIYMSGVGRHTSDMEKIASTTDFFLGLFSPEDSDWLASRLLDRSDEFGVEAMTQLLERFVAVWSGRPTEQSSASTTSRRTAGQKSTRRTPART